jgi:pantoate--beta-alanine ligase
MNVVKTVDGYKELRNNMQPPVGFVPTMGYLHEGHLELVRKARKENNIVIVSIFVNPTQFGPSEDFEQYPRDTERDLSLLNKEKTDIVLMPPSDEMYPKDFDTWVDVKGVTERLEGEVRQGHFRGVATVVAKLFNIVEPDKAYFGQKDAQQAVVIRKMAKDLNMNLEIVICPTVREPDGLAMSSRNSYLSKDERSAALVLWDSLNLARQLWSNGERSSIKIKQEMVNLIQKEKRAKIDYVSIADSETLEEMEKVDELSLVSLAVYIGKTRLIDNIMLGTNEYIGGD